MAHVDGDNFIVLLPQDQILLIPPAASSMLTVASHFERKQ